jgi:hypothetical protein
MTREADCRYCLTRAAEFSGDPTFGVPRCGACRRRHRILGACDAAVQAAVVALFLLASLFRPELAAGAVGGVFILLITPRFSRITLSLHWWVELFDTFNGSIRRKNTFYYDRLWRHARVSLRDAIDYVAVAAIAFAVWRWRDVGGALAAAAPPERWPAASGDDPLFYFLASIEGLPLWRPVDPQWGLVAGIAAMAGALWLAGKLGRVALARLLGTRLPGFPHLDWARDGREQTVAKALAELTEKIGYPQAVRELPVAQGQLQRYIVKRFWYGLPRRNWLEVPFVNGVRGAAVERLETAGEVFARLGKLVLTLAAIALAAAAIESFGQLSESFRIERALRELRPGMRRAEVVDRFGDPSSTQSGTDAFLRYENPGAPNLFGSGVYLSHGSLTRQPKARPSTLEIHLHNDEVVDWNVTHAASNSR